MRLPRRHRRRSRPRPASAHRPRPSGGARLQLHPSPGRPQSRWRTDGKHRCGNLHDFCTNRTTGSASGRGHTALTCTSHAPSSSPRSPRFSRSSHCSPRLSCSVAASRTRSTRSPVRTGSGWRLGHSAFSVGSWPPSALGAPRSLRRAAARIGVGCMVNSFAPAKLGDAVKIALCSKAIDGPGRLWTTGGVYVALAAARSLTLALLVVLASATGAMPIWPVFVIFGAVGLLAVAGAFSGRLRSHPRIAHVLGGLAALERSPRAIATVLGWTAVMQLTRLGGTAAVAAALGLPHPLLAA